jgi:hypothetical protein
MPDRKRNLLLALALLVFASLACSALSKQVQPTSASAPTAVLVLTQITEPVITQSSGTLPATEAEVPRVPVDVAKAAFDTGQAIIVDVRSADAYAASHVKGAINLQLGEIENNPSGLKLNKNQWIITYCT